MFDLLYGQSYVLKWKHLSALLDMFDPNRGFLPDDDVIDEMIDLEYIIYNPEDKSFYAKHAYRALIDLFLSYKAAVNIESPKVKELSSALSMYFLPNRKHMLVLLQGDTSNNEENMVEIAISDKYVSPNKAFEQIGNSILNLINSGTVENFDPQKLPISYKIDYQNAVNSGRLFRVTSLEPSDSNNEMISVFAAFPSQDECYWVTATNYNKKRKDLPIIVKKLSGVEYQGYLSKYFELYLNNVWGEKDD